MGDRVAPRAEDGLAPRRHLIPALALAAVAAILAGCGSTPYTQATFVNDVGRPVRLGWCHDDPTCRRVHHWIAVDAGAEATELVPSGGGNFMRFVAVGPPETVYGCFTLSYGGGHAPVTLPLSRAHGCGSGR